MLGKFTRWVAAPVFAAATMVAGCKTVQTTQPGTVGVERQQRMAVSQEQFDQAGVQAYQQVLQEAQQKGALNRDAAQAQRVRRIAGRLVPSTAAFRTDAPGWKWEANVLSSDEVNAWVMPGGKIAVYSALIEKLKVTDDELAAVMGHEMAHALREHSREQASMQMAQNALIGLGAAVLGVSEIVQQMAGIVTDITINRRYSRQHETEADRIGVELAARSGFDPRAAIALWNKMASLGGGEPPQWLSTHPSNEARTRDLQEYAQRVMPLYQAAAKR